MLLWLVELQCQRQDEDMDDIFTKYEHRYEFIQFLTRYYHTCLTLCPITNWMYEPRKELKT